MFAEHNEVKFGVCDHRIPVELSCGLGYFAKCDWGHSLLEELLPGHSSFYAHVCDIFFTYGGSIGMFKVEVLGVVVWAST